jgi:hypothetical protein
MKFAQVTNTEADKIWVNILNTQASALDEGDLVVWSTTTPDGVRTMQPTTATLSLFVGVADSAIAASAYGLAQSYGYRGTALVTNATNVSIAAGNILVPVNAADYAAYSAASDGKSGFLFAGEAFASNATPAAAKKKVFIKSM